ncbi:hypothetical protein GF359_06740 [candidate division WOR-3 bacterium]|uniref:Uncharacterized protein n=1 Tax=candidate division WOR-3 bacterium TaxID=2052148 RepID=A0A9D5KA52_UNCW3|nr:hypothetical protein [candidate division WOR-3 bacterium]MBD3364895.1 hypothetical protein [candidate division WOR-3 bacterium]
MLTIFICLFTYVEPGDTNIYAGMNSYIAQFSRYWETVYETSPSGFRTSQGCVDFIGWYMLYNAKTEADFNKTFSMRYRFHMLRHYDDTITQHRFEPTMRVVPNIYAHVVMVPFYHKTHNETGIGLSWRRGCTDWLGVYALVQRYDHNFSLMFINEGPDRTPYEKLPVKFEVDGRGETDWLRARFHGEFGTRSHQYLDWPDSAQYIWDRYKDSTGLWGRIEVQPVKGLWTGGRFMWERDRWLTTWRQWQDSVTYDSLYEYWVEPFVSYNPTERLMFEIAYRFWDVSRRMDTVDYYSDFDVFSSLICWQPVDWFVFEGGYQRSVRTRYNNDTTIREPWKGEPGQPQSRLIFDFEFRLKSGMMFSIKEGLEMDNFPRRLFRSPHNHTYVLLYMPLAVLKPETEKESIKVR